VKILVVDDHALVREGLRQVLKGLDTGGESLEVFEAGSCARALEIGLGQPDLDLVLLDYHLPDMNGMEALELFASHVPELPIIVLSGSVNPRIMQQVLNKGAAAFLTKSGMSDELLTVTRQVLDGQFQMPLAQRADSVFDTSKGLDSQPQPLFTPRQEEVLLLLMEGCSNKVISRTLGLSDETVKTHITSLLRGFGVHSRTQAVLAANRMGYAPPVQSV
jgi:DNA-binding NarL/FixJ family response regulator